MIPFLLSLKNLKFLLMILSFSTVNGIQGIQANYPQLLRSTRFGKGCRNEQGLVPLLSIALVF